MTCPFCQGKRIVRLLPVGKRTTKVQCLRCGYTWRTRSKMAIHLPQILARMKSKQHPGKHIALTCSAEGELLTENT